MSTGNQFAVRGTGTLSRDQSHAVFGQVMGLVALTVGFAALGAYIARDWTGSTGLLMLIAVFGCVIGLNVANSRGKEQLAIALLFGLGLSIGLLVGPIVGYYAKTDPAVVWQAAGATGGFIAAAGAFGYATRRDLSSWARFLFWALLALIVFGVLLIFVRIPNGNIIYAVLGLVIFGAFTIFDFNRLRRANQDAAIPIAASIFLDIFNVFLFFLQIFGGGGRN
jgi:modulator of FtsH protease